MNARKLLPWAILVASAAVALFVYVSSAPKRGQQEPLAPGTTVEVRKVGHTSTARLSSVSPRQISNQSDYPLVVAGEHLEEHMTLELYYGDKLTRLETTRLDDGHLTVMIPAGLPVAETRPLDDYRVRLLDADRDPVAGVTTLTVVNDSNYPQPYALARIGEALFATSITTDALLQVGGSTRTVADRPRALAKLGADLLVLHETNGEIFVVTPGTPSAAPRRLSGPRGAQDIAVDESSAVAYVSSRFTDAIDVIDLGSGRRTARYAAGINPGPIVLAGEFVAVGNTDSGEVTLVNRRSGEARSLAPRPKMRIVGGRSGGRSATIMGGTTPRDLAYSARLDTVFVSNVGPAIGPNPERADVTTNGGVTVLDPKTGTYLRHVSMLRGVPMGLAIDDARGLLYVADIGAGRVVVFDAAKMVESDTEAAHALLGAVEIPAPTGGIFRLQPADQFATNGRNTDSIHSGPRAIALSSDGLKGWVLDSFTGHLTELDLREAPSGLLKIASDEAIFELGKETERRAGEVVFTTDLANSGLSCETCHFEGRGEGVVLTKPSPRHHIYRVSNLRGVRETPPYFTPPFYKSLPASAGFLSHIRFQNPPANAKELAALTAYLATLVAPPNPYRLAANGNMPESLTLPDGRTGHPMVGMALFEGKAKCATCHPAPVFSADQDKATRGRTYDVGTPATLGLRPQMQDVGRYPLASPTLVGVWDTFPLLHSGAAGYEVRDDRLVTTGPFPLRRVFEAGAKHGEMGALTATEVDDLLAYVLTL